MIASAYLAAEALGEWVDGAAVSADGRIANLGASVHLYPSCYLPSRRWPTGLSQSLCLTITSACCIPRTSGAWSRPANREKAVVRAA